MPCVYSLRGIYVAMHRFAAFDLVEAMAALNSLWLVVAFL